MKEMIDVEFGGKLYTTRLVSIDGYGDERIAEESLQNVLLKDGKYVSNDARELDECIFFYAPDEYLQKSDIELAEYVESMLV